MENIKTGYYTDGSTIWFLSRNEIMRPMRFKRYDPENGSSITQDTPSLSGFTYLGREWSKICETVRALDDVEEERSKRDYQQDWNEFLNYINREASELTCENPRYCITTVVERVVTNGTKWITSSSRREFVLSRIKRQDYFDLIYEFLPDVKLLSPPKGLIDTLTWRLDCAKIMSIMTEEVETKFDIVPIQSTQSSNEDSRAENS